MLALIFCAVTSSDYHRNVQSVVDAELAFAKMGQKNLDEAFLAQMDDQTIHLQNGLEMAKKEAQKRPITPNSFVLEWAPSFADVSAAGDLGYTTGPWFIKAAEGKPITARGNYFTVWHRNGNGRWWMVVDHGVGGPGLSYLPTSFSHPDPHLFEGIESPQSSVNVADEAYSAAVTAKNAIGMRPYLNQYSRMHWNTIAPAVGVNQVFAAVEKAPSPIYKHMGGGMAKSNDMYWCYGSLNRDGVVAGHYVRVWRLFAPGNWKLAINVNVPVPPKPAGE